MYSIGQFARRSRISAKTLRHYERTRACRHALTLGAVEA
jgi:DNA-binding transcriptional MerR regulator